MKTALALLPTRLRGPLAVLHAVDTPTLRPPQHFAVPKAGQSVTNRAFTGIASIAVAPKGRIWAVWYAGVTPGEDANNHVGLSVSGVNSLSGMGFHPFFTKDDRLRGGLSF
jgi:hypothetical protein